MNILSYALVQLKFSICDAALLKALPIWIWKLNFHLKLFPMWFQVSALITKSLWVSPLSFEKCKLICSGYLEVLSGISIVTFLVSALLCKWRAVNMANVSPATRKRRRLTLCHRRRTTTHRATPTRPLVAPPLYAPQWLSYVLATPFCNTERSVCVFVCLRAPKVPALLIKSRNQV